MIFSEKQIQNHRNAKRRGEGFYPRRAVRCLPLDDCGGKSVLVKFDLDWSGRDILNHGNLILA